MANKRISDSALASLPVQNGQILKGEHLGLLRELFSAGINENKADIDRILTAADTKIIVYGDSYIDIVNYTQGLELSESSIAILVTAHSMELYKYVNVDTWSKVGDLDLSAMKLDVEELKRKLELEYYDADTLNHMLEHVEDDLKEYVDDKVISAGGRIIYWQGHTSALLGDIITDMLGQAQNSTRPNSVAEGDLCDVYELTVVAYNDSEPYQGTTMIYVPNDEDKRIVFYLSLVGLFDITLVDHVTDLTEELEELDYYGYRVLLKQVATNQPYLHSYS